MIATASRDAHARHRALAGRVLEATWKPFAAATPPIVVAGLVFEHCFPGAHTLGEARRIDR